MTSESSDTESYLDIEANGENVSPDDLASLLRMFADALDNAPPRRLYDSELVIEEKSFEDAIEEEIENGE